MVDRLLWMVDNLEVELETAITAAQAKAATPSLRLQRGMNSMKRAEHKQAAATANVAAAVKAHEAAKAARELDASRNASSAIELIKAQEATKQHEAAAKRSEMEAYAQQMRQQNIQAEAEEARKTLEAQTQHDKHRTDYKDELERKRQVDMLNAQKYMQE